MIGSAFVRYENEISGVQIAHNTNIIILRKHIRIQYYGISFNEFRPLVIKYGTFFYF
jgi:hypothetical protein